MARDYGQRGGARRSSTRGKGSMPGWVWMVAGLSLGLAVAALAYITRPVETAVEPGAGAGQSTQTKAPQREKIPLPPEAEQRFTFYEILPSQEVVVPREVLREAARPSARNGDPTASRTYLIQVASYRSQTDAERQKATLALIGLESRIETVTIDGRETYYRVRVGPIKGMAQAHTLMTRLEENGIRSLLVQVP
jgi:cell division protein FtsN